MISSVRNYRLPIKLLPFIALLFLFVFGGCSTVQQQKTTPPKTGTEQLQKQGGTSETATTQVQKTTLPPTPQIIKSATIEIEVGKGEFQKKFDQAQAIADQVGGYATKSDASATKGEITSGTATLRVPRNKFNDAINRLKKLGDVKKSQTNAEDVSEEYVDLQSRLKNYQAQESALIQLMARSQSVQDTLSVQQALASVQEQIELITGRLNFLSNRVDYSTITVTIQEPGAVVPSSDEWGFVSALGTAARAFIGAINVIIIAVGALAPFIIIGIVLWYVIRMIRKKQK